MKYISNACNAEHYCLQDNLIYSPDEPDSHYNLSFVTQKSQGRRANLKLQMASLSVVLSLYCYS